jgi:nucleotide-binding universal stress UspA family protein
LSSSIGIGDAELLSMKRILVGLDGSCRASTVLREALSFAQELRAQLVLMRAVGLPKDFPVEAYSLAPSDVTRLLELRARQELEMFARSLPPENLGGICVQSGVPWQAICSAAQTEKVDLIFLGTQGNAALDRLLGTTAAKVVANADRPVLVFREPPVVHVPLLRDTINISAA